MSAAEAKHWADQLSKGLNVSFFVLILVAAAVTAVRAARGERPTKETWQALFLGGIILFAIMPEVIPHSKVPALLGTIASIGAALWSVIRSRSRRR